MWSDNEFNDDDNEFNDAELTLPSVDILFISADKNSMITSEAENVDFVSIYVHTYIFSSTDFPCFFKSR